MKNQDKYSQNNRQISDLQRDFSLECQICFQQYNNNKNTPLIICPNDHLLCSTCVQSNIFKKQYDEEKNLTGKYLCSKCSQLIDKSKIKENKNLIVICNHIQKMKKKQQEINKQFYQYFAQIVMNLSSRDQDYQRFQQKRQSLKIQHQKLTKKNNQLKKNIQINLKTQKQLILKIQQNRQNLQYEQIKLQSIGQEYNRLKQQIDQINKNKRNLEEQKDSLIRQNKKFKNKRQAFQETIQKAEREKEKLEKIIRTLKIQRDQMTQQIDKRKIIKEKQQQQQQQQQLQQQFVFKQKQTIKSKFDISQKLSQQTLKINFDLSEKSSKHFSIVNNIVKLTNDKLSNYVSISFSQAFKNNRLHNFKVKIRRLKSDYIMIGLMSKDCKNKKQIYNKNGFYAIDGFKKIWSDSVCQNSNLDIKQGDQISVTWNPGNFITWRKQGQRKQHKFNSQTIILKTIHKQLYPVVLLIESGDSVKFTDVN